MSETTETPAPSPPMDLGIVPTLLEFLSSFSGYGMLAKYIVPKSKEDFDKKVEGAKQSIGGFFINSSAVVLGIVIVLILIIKQLDNGGVAAVKQALKKE